ncbi:MAG TPA: 2'-5' RNA ligase family protein [Flavisolibacter sp.]|nr:2'-5' RNA ligase family protein [Flavisolibacter sp.]
MQPFTSPMPGYKINEYLLVLAPHEDLCIRILNIKEEFAKNYKAPFARARPHLTLVNFVNWSLMEERLMQRLHSIAMGVTPFKIELKDYGSFPSHTIFINVATKLPVQGLVAELRTAQRLMKLNSEHKPHFIDEPHLTISRKLKPWQYEQGWLEYSHRQFTSRFIADSMLLLKRPAGEKGKYQIAGRFDFQNLPVTTIQGSLFC